MSSMLARNFYAPEPNFNGLFRLLDDFDSYSRQAQTGRHGRQQLLTPKFDVRETEKTYELHGELPGASRDNIKVQFTGDRELAVSARVERNYTSGTPPAAAVEDDTSMTGAITAEAAETSSVHSANSHKATVTDEETEAARESGSPTPEETPKTEVAKPVQQAPTPKERYWHQERTVGQFHRTFTFPTPVDEEGVKASFVDGVLHLSVPKAEKHGVRNINIQ